jgi:tagaturonate reductase
MGSINKLNMQLSKIILNNISSNSVQVPLASSIHLPERIIQFGTGVLLRGLPDYFIHQANKNNIFNGRVVVVKSTSVGQTDAFDLQQGLFTHCIEGVKEGKQIQDFFINSAISRVLAANTAWSSILALAENKQINIIFSNVTEAGFVLDTNDRITGEVPKSFPGKLLALLYKRYVYFNGALDAGYIILPTELVPDNGHKLFEMIKELALLNQLPLLFMDWLGQANDFCNTLVDRIVPGKLPNEREIEIQKKLGYKDELMIVSEPYALWAIESNNARTKDILSFANQPGIVVAPSIIKYRELKLRLLNGTHTFSCAIAHLMGFETVKDAMLNETFNSYIKLLMHKEIIPCLLGNDISFSEASNFANDVIDRFKNPYLSHRWESIMVDIHTKMKTRNIPLIKKFLNSNNTVPTLMAFGYAAYTVVTDMKVNFLGNTSFTERDLFEKQVKKYVESIKQNGIALHLEQLVLTKETVNES